MTISLYSQRPVRPLRTFPLPAADVDSRGRLYVAWQDCRFRSGCPANDIVLARSANGTSWGAPTRLTRDGGSDFVPGSRSTARAAGSRLVYHRCSGSPCKVDVLVTTSQERRQLVEQPAALTAQPMNTAWLPTTVSGRMVGDYIAAAWSGGRAVAVYSLASPPGGGEFRQAIAAARSPRPEA